MALKPFCDETFHNFGWGKLPQSLAVEASYKLRRTRSLDNAKLRHEIFAGDICQTGFQTLLE